VSGSDGVPRLTQLLADEIRDLAADLHTDTYFSVEYQRRALASEFVLLGVARDTGLWNWRATILALLMPSWSAIFLYRQAIMARSRGWGRLSGVLTRLNLSLNGCDIAPNVRLAAPCFLRHPTGVVMGHGTVMGPYCQIHGGCQFVRDPSEIGGQDSYPRLGEGVFVGAGAVLIGGVEVGNQAVIGALASVTESVPARAVVAGPRATVVRGLREDEAPDERARRRL
jgi:serine acetyltransferase